MDVELIIATRNDNYCGDPMERLRHTLFFASMAPPTWRITVVDWGSDVPVRDALFPARNDDPDRVRYLRVPPEVTKRFDTPFSEVHALNYAARHARCPMIGRIDQDTCVGGYFLEWAERRCYNPDLFYFSNRRDMPEGVRDLHPGHPINGDVSHFEFVSCPVGILLVPRDLWCDVRGYDETMIHYNHMEREFIRRLQRRAQLVNLGLQIGVHFFHQWHPHHGLERRQNPSLTLEEYLTRPIIANGPDWGLGELTP